MMSFNINNITILNIHVADYRCIIKSDVINLLAIADLSEKSGPLFFFTVNIFTIF